MENKGFYSGMGVSDSGSYSMGSFSFKDLERLLSNLLDDNAVCNALTPEPETLTDIFALEKLDYFTKVSENIMTTKKNFIQVYNTINRRIEEMTREIILSISVRKEELLRELRVINENKIEKWDNQLAVCEEGLRQLREENHVRTGLNLNFTVSRLQQEVNLVDAGDLKFEVDNYQTILKEIKTLGTISSQTETKWIEGGVGRKSVTPKFTFGSTGEQPGFFCRPWGVCSDATGRILVCDRSNHRIQIFDESGKFLIQFGKEGTQPGEFNRPSGIDVDAKCRIVVADKDNHRIQVFTYSGYYIFEFGSQGSGPGQFQYPWDVAVNKSCDIAVSDSKNHRVQLFNAHGNLLAVFDASTNGIVNPRSRLRFMDSPRGLAFRPDGSLLVTDFNNHKIFLIKQNFRTYSTFGCEGIYPGQFFRPQGIACDKDGRIAVSDSKNYRVQLFDSNGNLLRVFGCQGSEPGHFDCPQGISFHPNLNILVVDLNNDRVQVF